MVVGCLTSNVDAHLLMQSFRRTSLVSTMRLFFRSLSALNVVTAATLLQACAGCFSGASLTFPVEGLVTVNGQPAPGVNIVFHVQQEQPEIYSRPSAKSGPDGRFRLTSCSPGDGALPGRYLITLTRRTPSIESPGGVLGGGAPDTVLADQFLGRYENPQTSGFSFEVRNTRNVVPSIDLKLP